MFGVTAASTTTRGGGRFRPTSRWCARRWRPTSSAPGGSAGWGEHGDAKLDINWVLYYRIRDGKIAEVQNFAPGQHAADLFYWEVWGESLKLLPYRLSGA